MNLIKRISDIESQVKSAKKDGHGIMFVISEKNGGYLVNNVMFTLKQYQDFKKQHKDCDCSLIVLTRFS